MGKCSVTHGDQRHDLRAWPAEDFDEWAEAGAEDGIGRASRRSLNALKITAGRGGGQLQLQQAKPLSGASVLSAPVSQRVFLATRAISRVTHWAPAITTRASPEVGVRVPRSLFLTLLAAPESEGRNGRTSRSSAVDDGRITGVIGGTRKGEARRSGQARHSRCGAVGLL